MPGQALPLRDSPRVAITDAAKARLKEMFENHHETIWRLMLRRGLDAEAAADMTQQAFTIAAERLGDIRPGCEHAFLLETAIRLARAASRKMTRLQFEEDMDLHVAPAMRADEILDQRRAIDIFDRVLGTLTADLLEVFLLFEMEKLSMREIAGMLAIPIGTVASRIRRAREAFREESTRIERALLDGRQR